MTGGAPFNPKEVIFAPTAACNLHCAHCRVDRSRGTGAKRLTVERAITFLRDCADNGIERVGFSGGEPFLAFDFLVALCAETVNLDLFFDRLMTNGDWYKDESELRETLEAVYDAGFDGTIGLSLDDWHGQDGERAALFLQAAIEISGRPDGVEIDSALTADGRYPTELLKSVAASLSARSGSRADLILDGGLPVAIAGAEGLRISVTGIPYSRPSDDPEAWKEAAWFKDDWCLGPGNVLYAHADGSVAACCGFANERPELALGTVDDPVEALIAAGLSGNHTRLCYQTGLATYRAELEARGFRFPGKTGDICFFCDWLCAHGPYKQS